MTVGEQIAALFALGIAGLTVVALYKSYLDDKRKGIKSKLDEPTAHDKCEQLSKRMDEIEDIRTERATMVDQRMENFEERLESAITVIRKNRKRINSLIERFIHKSF